MVMEKVPMAAELLAERVSVEDPAPGAAIEDGLKLAVTPDGRPLADSEIAELNPPATVVVAVAVPDEPWAKVRDPGLTPSVKLGLVPGETVRLTGAVRVSPPPLPVIVMGKVPVDAVELAENVRVELPPPGAAMVDGLKLAVTPEGRPLALSETALLKPPEIAVVMVEVPLDPCTTLTEVGLAVSEKLGFPPPPKVMFSTGWISI
jgi:hypothetical protein